MIDRTKLHCSVTINGSKFSDVKVSFKPAPPPPMTLFAVMLRCLQACNDHSQRLSELRTNFKHADSLLVEPAVDRLIQLELLEWVKQGHGRRRLRLDTTKRGERILSKRQRNLSPFSGLRLDRILVDELPRFSSVRGDQLDALAYSLANLFRRAPQEEPQHDADNDAD